MIGIIKSLHPFHMNEAKDVINPLAILGAKPSGGTPQAFQEIVWKDWAQRSRINQSQEMTGDVSS